MPALAPGDIFVCAVSPWDEFEGEEDGVDAPFEIDGGEVVLGDEEVVAVVETAVEAGCLAEDVVLSVFEVVVEFPVREA
jgi:hypothetical protein